MTRLGVATKSQCLLQVGEMPSGLATMVRAEVEEEPPSSSARTNRDRFFGHVSPRDWCDWKWQFRNRITAVDELSRYIPLSTEEVARLRLVSIKYPLSVTPYYLSLINLDDNQDPIRRQAVPCFEEVTMGAVGYEDPLEEQRESVVPGLVHRYPDRVLMVLTDICAMLCRHCTRKREWTKGGWVRDAGEVEAMLQYIRRHTEVRDVVISGGDPLTLSTRRLESVLIELRKIKHVEIIRIGTRFPVVLPYRIDDELCNMLSKYGPIWLNTHFNHPREVTEEAAQACDRLLRAGVPVNNQSVLLRGVNDNVRTMTELCQRLLKAKVRPYYLFQCDEVQGTEHLRTPVETGVRIIEGMRGHTSGLAVPTFVVDLPHGGGKVSVQPDYIVSKSEGEIVFRNYEGQMVRYRNPGAPKAGACRRNGKSAAMTGASSFETLDPVAWRPA
ncbi:MAG: KamA family radical SAM protein [Dehalococcoidia bacterium]|nr:KamA family radical SAM protein [Dehalococcoidia bacterium]